MRIAITGSTGLIGSAVVPLLEARGHSITRLVRPGSTAAGVQWDPHRGHIDLEGLEGQDACVHLAGENLFGLWTPARKRRIRESRVKGTGLLATSLARLRRPPAVLVSASATGYYGKHPPNERVTETTARGSGFLAEVVDEWETATQPAADAGIRVALTRFGLVLSRKGGTLAVMAPLFRLGLGGHVASGKQVWSWVALDDVARAVVYALENAAVQGPVNVVAPQPVTNLAFTRTLGRVLRRPTIFWAPEFLLKTVAGEMADQVILSAARVVPEKLQAAGFDFQYPELEVALRHVLGNE